jgi:hypothetical protein
MLKRTILGFLFVALTSLVAAGQATTQFLQAPQYSTGAGSNPQAFAVADFNNDGIPDVAVANSLTNSVSIFLGNGDGTFTQANCGSSLNCATGTSPQGIAAGDFSRNGNMDLAVTNFSSDTITILSNSGQFSSGQGGFSVQSTLQTENNPRGIAVADFNGDGYPDIVIVNSGENPGTVAIYMNNGSGGFGTQATYTYNTPSNPWAVAVADFNNDGIPDVAVAIASNNNIISVYLGQTGTNGAFNGLGPQQQSYSGPLGDGVPVSIAVGDFNGDGDLDLAVAVQGAGQGLDNVSIMLGNGNGTFTQSVSYNAAPHPVSVVAADLNSDGNLDLALAAGNGNIVTVFSGNGDGTFGGQMNLGTGDAPSAVAVANLTNATSGLDDLIVSNQMGNSFSVIMNNGNDRFQSRLDYAAGQNAQSVVTADFNGDGIPDLAFADGAVSQIAVLLGNGDGTFKPPSPYTTGTATDPIFIVEGDFNQDGIPDLAVVNNATSTVSVFLGVGDGTFQPHADYKVGNPNDVHPVAQPTSIAVGDFNGDGYPDLAVTNYNENSVTILLNGGKASPGTFALGPNCTSSQNACPVGTGPVAIATGYFYGNQTLDLVVINESDSTATILQGNGDGTFTPESPTLAVGNNPVSVAVLDLNGDGIPDLAVADQASPGQVSVLLGNGSGGVGNGTFQTAVAYPTGTNPTGVVIGDFNGDGIPDLALTSSSSGANPGNLVSLLLGVPNSQGTASGTFGAAALFSVGYLSSSLVTGDFNLDGALDLATANAGSNTVSILLNTQGTKMSFTPSPQQTTYGQSLTLTATVAASVGNGAAPTGTVTFENGSTVIGTAQPLSSGQASVSTASLAAGTDSLAAVYSGDSNYQAHTVYLSQTVTPATSITSLTSQPDPAPPNSTVTFTASVTSPQSTGTVTFYNGSTSIGGGSLNASGQAMLSTSSLAMGTSNITAVFAGNSNVTGSTSSVLQQVMGKETPNILVTPNPTAANLNENVTLTATVSGVVGVPTGTVTFLSGTTQVGTATLNSNGVATYSTASLPAGTDSITASYSGDSDFLAGTSSPTEIVVTAPNFSLTANGLAPSSVAPGATATSQVTITAVGGLNPSTVKLTCAVTPTASPAATCALGNISVGANGQGTATLTFAAAGAQAALASPAGERGSQMLFAFGIVIPAMLLGGVGLSKPGRKKLMSFCLFLALAGCMAHMACGGGSSSSTPPPSGNSGTPAGAYQVMVSGSASGIQNSIPTPLSVTVQ